MSFFKKIKNNFKIILKKLIYNFGIKTKVR